MEMGDIYRANNSSLWNKKDEIFSRSSKDEDDEEALKWASLERLPTCDRLKKGLMVTDVEGGMKEVEIKNLGYEERKKMMERLIRVAEEDNEKFLQKLRERIDRVGIDIPMIEVRYENLNVEAEIHVGNRGLPTVLNSVINVLEAFGNYLHILPSRKKPLLVLSNISGIVKPQRMTLLLGPPGSGKTTFLLTLAGKLGSDLKVSGKVTYNGHGSDEFVLQRTAAYIGQHDLHIGELTVRETLAFSARCQGVGTRYDMLTELLRREKAANIRPDPDIDVFMKAASVPGQQIDVVTDYILKVTSRKDQEQYWARNEPYRFIPVIEFANAFESFHIGKDIKNELSVPYDKKKSHPAALKTSRYGVSMKELFKALFERELLLMKRNSFVYIFKATQLAITAFIRTDMHRDSVSNGRIYMGALFFSVIRILFNELSELPMTILKLPVFFKQRDLLFYPAWVYSIPKCITKIPIALVEVAMWVFMTYYVIGFDPNVERFFRQFLVFLLINQMASGLFRFIAGLTRQMIIANTVGSFALLMIMVLGGFVIGRDDVKKWWIWGYWSSPLMYAQNAVSANEFLGKSWSHILPGSMETLGARVLEDHGIFPEAKWYWIGVGALLGYIFLFNSLFTVALTYLSPYGNAQQAMSEETLKEKNANITGEISEPSSRENNPNVHSSLRSSSPSNQIKKGMVLPFAPLSVTFEDIRYSVDMPQEMKAQTGDQARLELLKGISGSFRPGVLTALMGVSGAGKTTLMDVLAGRKTGGYIEGNICINGYPKKQETFARVSGYCEQNDIHSPHVTVYESLVYSSWLRLPSEVNSETRKMFIEEVMELVELKPLREALVGLPGVNGLSTEQRKRLTIAVELVANPSIIFMDEPTSGLDARAAAIVMRTVRNTVDTGRTVVCTIHQPSINIFEAFDELFLMKRGGEEIYVGPLGHHSCHLIKYFEEIQGVSKIKDGYNPATWMLEATTLAQEKLLSINFTDVYKTSLLFQRNKELIKELSSPAPGSRDLLLPTQYSQSFYTQCFACLWKQNLSYWRNPPYVAVRFFFTFVIALLFGTIFWDLGTKRNRYQDLFNAMGSMYASVLFIGVKNASSVQPVVSVERTVFYRERAAGMYSAFPYSFAQIAIELPYVFVQALMYGVIVYAMIGFEWTVAKFFWYLFFMYFTLLYFTFYGMMAIGLTPNQSISSIVSSSLYSLWNLFSGFIIPRTMIPIWWRWYYWICPVSWTLYGLVASQFGDVQEKLETGEVVSEFLTDYFGFKHNFLGVVAVVVVAFPLLFASLFGFSMKVLNFQRR
ncbi:uncharacterized protein A4U43_C06F10630 [Asparagus officinalis]|uniref:ABC transporter domain-containing protein n=1 Tax=Asparagus officinalis TaxID=4686 RepID=A0A5P1END7_ASPOF|nr:uncharacterized protein A4U43_C06F10630 [Asparagus officinalis]